MKMSCTEALAAPAPDMPTKKLILVVAAALLDRKKNILMAQRPIGKEMAGKWEFPGGKLEAGEIPEYALMRELSEELSIETRPCCMLPVGFTSYNYPSFHLLMPLYAIRVWKGEPTPQEGQKLQWMPLNDLYHLDLIEADKPLIPQLEGMI